MERSQIQKIAQSPEDRVLLAKLLEKMQAGMNRDCFASTGFLSPREQEMARYLFGKQDGLCTFGGYPHAERRMLCYLPEYLEPEYLMSEDSPVVCLRATYYEADSLTHRDFLGALMGAGIAREAVGDICVDTGSCDFFVTAQLAPYLLESFCSAGRTRFRLDRIPLPEAHIPIPETKQIKDTVASLRLDSVLSSGFRISRTQAASHIQAGRAAINGLPCEKPDRPVASGDKLSVRGLGKLLLREVNGTTKKGRIAIVIDRYL